jgi:hypothetical protein
MYRFKEGEMARCVNPYEDKILERGSLVKVFSHKGNWLEFTHPAHGRKITWAGHRFEPVVAEAHVKPNKFNTGDVVKCIEGHPPYLIEGQEYHVKPSWLGEAYVALEGVAASYDSRRFTLIKRAIIPVAPAVPLLLEVGCKVKVIEPHRHSGLHMDKVCTVVAVVGNLVRLKEHPAAYRRDRFVPVAAAPVAPAIIALPPRDFVVGDLVYITNRVEQVGDCSCQWVSSMEQYLNDGVAMKIVEIKDHLIKIRVEDGCNWYFLKECLSRTPPSVISVGDIVYVTSKEGDKGWVPPMDRYLNDGVQYVVEKMEYDPNWGPRVTLKGIGNWYFFTQDLTIVSQPAKPVEPAKAKAPETLGMRLVEKDKTPRPVISFAYYRQGDGEIIRINPPCFADLDYGGPITEFVISINAVNKTKDAVLREQQIAYIKWAINESPWAPCFITKNVEEAFVSGLVMNTKMTKSQCVCAAIVIRELTETPVKLSMFTYMLSQGYSGNVAYLASNAIRRAAGADTVTISCANGGHNAMASDTHMPSLLNFFANGAQAPGAIGSMEKAGGQYNVFGVIGKRVEPGFSVYVTTNCKGTTVGSGWGAITTIPIRSLFAFADKLENDIKEAKK